MNEAVRGVVLEGELSAGDSSVTLGAVVPFDEALDFEFWQWSPAEVHWLFTRTPWTDEMVGVGLALEVGEPDMVANAVRSISHCRPRAVAYGCTSGSFVNGVEGELRLQQALRRGGATAGVTTSGAIVEALRHLGARRPAVVTPYDLPTTRLFMDFLEANGLSTAACGYLDLRSDIENVAPSATRRLVADVTRGSGADSVVISCTNLRTFSIIRELEAELRVPVVSANQATVWATLRAGGVDIPSHGQRLFP
jgi:maleate isomerase